MGCRVIEGDQFRTRYEGAPQLRWIAVEDDPHRLELSFQTESAKAGDPARFTTLRFGSVFEFRWIESDVFYLPTNRDDFEFALIEIIDSELIEALVSSGADARRPAGQRLGGVLDERRLRHFRIGFDEHGAYDVVCLSVGWREDVKPSVPSSSPEVFDGQSL